MHFILFFHTRAHVVARHTLGSGSSGRHSAGRISFSLSFSDFGLTSEAEERQGFETRFWVSVRQAPQYIKDILHVKDKLGECTIERTKSNSIADANCEKQQKVYQHTG